MLTEFEDFYYSRVDEIELSLDGNEEYRENNKDFQENLTRVKEEQSILNALKHFVRNISRISIKEGYKQGFNDALKIMRGF